MSTLRIRKPFLRRLKDVRFFATVSPQANDEYTSSPQYPEILDLSWEKRRERKKQSVYDAIKACKTVEEKQIKLNMPKYYGFKTYLLQEDLIPYNNLEFTQHVTKTHLIRNENLPKFYSEFNVENLVNVVKNDIQEAILLENKRNCDSKDPVEVENALSSQIARTVNRILIKHLSRSHTHLKSVQIDLNSRIESFWYVGGMNPPENIKRYRRGIEFLKHEENEPTNRLMNYLGGATVALRTKNPLNLIISPGEAENPDLVVPFYQLDPRTVGTFTTHKHMANVPGFWPGDPNEFGLLSYHNRGHLLKDRYDDPQDNKEAIDRQGILSSFGWLSAQANMLGFTTFNDLTYPLVTQTVVTNGKFWSFYVYQLNTIEIHSKHIKENPKRNICWGTPETKLFEEVSDGKVIGFNDDVLKNLIRFYVNVPEERLGVNMKPYLNQETGVSANYEDDDKRQWLEREYKYLVANRPRYKLEHELYAWEKIYKIDHETRFMDKKRTLYDFGIKPWNRTLDDRQANYIPRAHRPHLHRSKGRYAKEYFP